MTSSGRSTPREHLAAIAVVGVLAVLFFSLTLRTHGSEAKSELDPSAELLRRDPMLTVDSLPNGLHFYLRANDNPSKTAELRLVVNAGSLVERDDERGVAHAVEHMAFVGTPHLPGTQLDDYLQSLGMRPGQDANAYTGYDETVYRLTIPTNESGTLDKAFTILEDWAHAVRFDSAQLARERAVVFEEWRTRQGVAQRLVDARTKALLGNTRYAARSPIGDTAIIRRFRPDQLERFYKEWYRPDLMAVVVVGDFSVSKARDLVQRHFASIWKPAEPVLKPQVTLPAAPVTRVGVIGDAEVTHERVSLWRLETVRPPRTVGELRARMASELFDAMLDARLDDISHRAESVVRRSTSGRTELVRGLDGHYITAEAAERGVLPAFDSLATEIERIRRFGFSRAEFERQHGIAVRQAEHENTVDEIPNSSRLAEEYVDSYLRGEPLISRSLSRQLYADELPLVKLDDVNRLAHELSIDSGRAVIITTPRARVIEREKGAVDARLASLREMPLVAHQDSGATGSLLARHPTPGRVVDEQRIDAIRATQWTLSNGMRVVLKPTRFRAHQVLMHAFSPGGASLASAADYRSAYMSDQVVGAMGIGAFDATQLEHVLDGNSASVTPSVNNHSFVLNGEADLIDLVSLFQLAHLYLTSPRVDSAAFRAMVQRGSQEAAERTGDPEAAFRDTIAVTLGQHHPWSLPATPDFYRSLDLGRALDFYRERIANGSNFTVVLIGSFVPAEIRELVEQYLGSVPAGRTEVDTLAGPRFPPGVVQRTVARGLDPKAVTSISFTGRFSPTVDSVQLLSVVTDVLSDALERRLRESMGGTYGVDVDFTASPPPVNEYAVNIEFTADPARLDTLVKATFAEVDRLRLAGPSARELGNIKAANAREMSEGLEDNEYWLSELKSHLQMKWPLETIMDHGKIAARIDTAAVRSAAYRFLRPADYVRVTRVPLSKN